LNLPVRTLSLGNALFPELERQYRTARQNKHRPSPSFSVAFLDTPTQRDWKQLIAGLQAAKGQPFVPMQTTPGMHDRPVRWLCCDASGKERAAGAAAIFDPAKPHEVTLAVIPWTEGQWTGEGLSTLQEGFTASTAARLLMQHMPPNTDLIEALDSMSASFILRAGKASSTERSDAVAKWRQTLMSRHRRFGGRSCGGNGSQKIRRRVTIVPATTQVVSAHTSPNKHKKDTYEMRSSSPAAIGRQVRKNKRVSWSRPAKKNSQL
jgi:hypothetical protein